jgi:hypothetical protein
VGSAVLDRARRMHFSPQPLYQIPKSSSQFARSQSGSGRFNFESFSLNRDNKSQNWNSLVRYLPCQPVTRSTRESVSVLMKSTAIYRNFERLPRVSSPPDTATLARIYRKSPARTAEIPVFGETIGGDRFDHDCAPYFQAPKLIGPDAGKSTHSDVVSEAPVASPGRIHPISCSTR